MYSDQQMQIAIETYVHEGLPPEAEDQLWIEFLKAPEFYEYFLTVLHLSHLFKKSEQI